MKDTDIKQIPLTAMFIALGVIFPQLFHIAGLGPEFMPMFLPVMIGAMLLSFKFAVILGIFTPVISWFITGMPPAAPPILPVMIVELATVSVICSLIKVRYKKSVWLAAAAAIAADRILLFLISSVILPLTGYDDPLFPFVIAVKGVPGIILMMTAVPVIVRFAEDKVSISSPGEEK